MLGAYGSAAVLIVASLVVGRAVLSLSRGGRGHSAWLAGPVGLGALLAMAGIVVALDGCGTAVALATGALVAGSLAVIGVRDRPRPGPDALVAAAAGLLALVAASIPFIAAGRIGILGVGLINDDMASHLLMADWLDARFEPEPVLIDQGYPLGPHALAAGLAQGLGTGLIEAFAGLTLAIPVLTALVAAGALRGLRPPARVVAAGLTALPYLAAAYLAQEAFKEPMVALFTLSFALLLPGTTSPRRALPLGAIAAGAVYVYSFPGLVWLVGAASAWGAFQLLAGGPPSRERLAGLVRRGLPVGALGVVALLALTAPDWGRIIDFADFRALDPDRANEGGLGNLGRHLSPLQGLGIWPTSEFRLAAGAGALPAAAFYAAALVAAAALAWGMWRWLRRYGPAVPAALAAAAAIYVGARAFGTVYTSAKALAIAAPLVVLVALGGLLHPSPPGSIRTPRALLALALIVSGALSSFLVLRQAPVAPEEHMRELAELRPLVAGEKVLFLGRDNFVVYELRGSRPFVHVRNFYDPYYVRPNPALREAGLKFDFDSVRARALARFPFVITTRAAYGSGPPPGFEVERATRSFALWRQTAEVGRRKTLDEGSGPGAVLECRGSTLQSRRGVAAVAPRRPVVGDASEWSPEATVEGGEAASQSLRLGPGRWAISIQYDATRPLRVEAPGLVANLPANLDFRGPGPFWPAGELRVREGGPVELTARVDEPAWLGRLLGRSSVAHLGAIAATPARGSGYVRGEPPLPGAGERVVSLGRACGRFVDWLAPATRRPGAR